ncbi:MAG: flavodoxin family protein [Candidatus Lernaella stagnicola]|nr:flavodoxin family protein [Candidatus Lernaella stagnicola]
MNQDRIHVLGLAASPRREGNSETLLDAFLDGAVSAGAVIEKIRLAERKIAPCIACEKCYETGVCCLQDDAADILEKLLVAHVIVLATPVYFYSVTTQAKLLIDRCQALWARQELLGQTRRHRSKGVLLAVAGSRGEKLFDGVRLTTRYWMNTFLADLVAERVFRGVDDRDGFCRRAADLEDVRRLGKSVAEEII